MGYDKTFFEHVKQHIRDGYVSQLPEVIIAQCIHYGWVRVKIVGTGYPADFSYTFESTELFDGLMSIQDTAPHAAPLAEDGGTLSAILAEHSLRDYLGIQDTSTPNAGEAGGGYTAIHTEHGIKLYSPSVGFMASINKHDMDSMVDILNGETESLRSQLAAAQARIRELESVINKAHSKIAQARDKQFDQEYAAADSAMKNAEVYLAPYTTIDTQD